MADKINRRITKKHWTKTNSLKRIICETTPWSSHILGEYKGQYYCAICCSWFNRDYFNHDKNNKEEYYA